jgi:mRNA interferase MazF
VATARCEPWQVLAVPFPDVERPIVQRRPALVVAAGLGLHRLAWVLMITSAANPGWPDDVEVSDHAAAGLPIPSVVRTAKIATIAPADSRRIGRLDDLTVERVADLLERRRARP